MILGRFPLGRVALGQTSLFNGYTSVLLFGSTSFGAVPTSNYKMILATDNNRKLIFAAEISPWTLSQ